MVVSVVSESELADSGMKTVVSDLDGATKTANIICNQQRSAMIPQKPQIRRCTSSNDL